MTFRAVADSDREAQEWVVRKLLTWSVNKQVGNHHGLALESVVGSDIYDDLKEMFGEK